MAAAEPDVSALAINVAIPEPLRWTAVRKDVEYELQTLNVSLLRDGSLRVKAYGRRTDGTRGNAYAAFPVRESRELSALVAAAAARAGDLWSAADG